MFLFKDIRPKYFSIILLVNNVFFTVNSIQAQDWLGYHTSTYSGIQGIHVNPALITGSNYKKFDISIVAAHANISNDFLYFDAATITNPNLFSRSDFFDVYVRQNLNGATKNAMINANIQGPAFLYQFTPYDAIGFSPRVRAFGNIDRLDENLAKLIVEELNYPPNWNTLISRQFMSATAHAWAEYGISYGRIIYADEKHTIKGGITAKLLQGLGAGYLTFTDYSYNFYNDQVMGIYDTYGSFGLSQNVQDQEFRFGFEGGPGFGMDIGFTYEFKPNGIFGKTGLIRPRKNSYGRETGIWAKDETRYKFKVGISLNDVGGLMYAKSTNSRDFYANVDSLSLSVFNNINGPGSLAQTLQAVFVQSNNTSNFFIDLPTHLHLFFDYRIDKGFAVHTSVMLPFNHGIFDHHKNHYIYQLAVTPRWESKWFGVYLPISFNEYLLYNLGISLRLGPLVIGTGDILGTLIKREYASLDVHMGLRLIFPKKSKKINRSKCPAYL